MDRKKNEEINSMGDIFYLLLSPLLYLNLLLTFNTKFHNLKMKKKWAKYT